MIESDKQAGVFRRLLRDSLAATLACAAVVALCYFFVDRPVAFLVHYHKTNQVPELEWLTLPPPILQAWTPVVLAALLARRALGQWRRWERTLFAASVALVLADQFRETLSFAFGRYWPETWIRDATGMPNNPSLIRDDVYGFHPFHGGEAYGSFPSGHAARTAAAAAVVWIAYQPLRWDASRPRPWSAWAWSA